MIKSLFCLCILIVLSSNEFCLAQNIYKDTLQENEFELMGQNQNDTLKDKKSKKKRRELYIDNSFENEIGSEIMIPDTNQLNSRDSLLIRKENKINLPQKEKPIKISNKDCLTT